MDNNVKNILIELKDKYRRYTNFAYYNSNLSNKRFMIILQNPGYIKETDQEKIDLNNCHNDENFIHICQKGLRDWIKSKNTFFWEKLVEQMQTIDGNMNKENILDSFLITDVNKERKKSKIHIKNKKRFDEEILKKEIEIIGPKLILVFGSIAWRSIQKIYMKDLISFEKDIKIKSVSQNHGYLFKLKNLGVYIIPLLHFSEQVRNSCPRESCFDYMKDGFNKFKTSQNEN